MCNAGGETVEPSAEARIALERLDRAHRLHQRHLRGFLGVFPRAGDTRRKTIQALTVALDELIGGVWILSAQCLHERGIAIDLRIQHVGHLSITSRLTRSHHGTRPIDRKSTRLNSSHRCISYAVFCLKKKKKKTQHNNK